ncbi:MAG: hypothetical protein ACJ0A9_03935 [Dehalococcoidia bacterium]
MIRYLLIMLMFLFIISCSDNQDPSGGSSLQAGVAGTKTEMQQPTVQVGPTLNITVKIPAAMWVGGFVENQITVPFGLHEDQAYTKVMTCQVEGEGKPIAIGEPIEIIQEETCTHASFTNKSGLLKHYNVGMFKIRVISTGEEGWVFGASIPESARGSDE